MKPKTQAGRDLLESGPDHFSEDCPAWPNGDAECDCVKWVVAVEYEASAPLETVLTRLRALRERQPSRPGWERAIDRILEDHTDTA